MAEALPASCARILTCSLPFQQRSAGLPAWKRRGGNVAEAAESRVSTKETQARVILLCPPPFPFQF